MDIEKVNQELRRFAAAREWEQFHTPKNLAMALGGEAGELLEIFQWLTPEQSGSLAADERQRSRVAEELADILIYALRIADGLSIDIERAVADKIAANAQRYPVELAKGNARKQIDLNESTEQ